MERFVRQMIMILAVFLVLLANGNVWGQDPCLNSTAITCGQSVSGTLGISGEWSSSYGGHWSCVGEERIYTFTASNTGQHTFIFTDNTGDPDYFILESCSNSANCIGYAVSGTVNVNFEYGHTYYIVADNYSSSNLANYTINLSGCPNQSVTHSVTYNANGGSGTLTDPSSPYNDGSTVTVLPNSFNRDGYNFVGWNTMADGNGTSYAVGATLTLYTDVVLYAQWILIIPPEPQEWTKCYTFEDNIIPSRFENDETYPWTIVSNDPNHVSYCLKSGNGGIANSTSAISIDVEYESNGLINFNGGIYGEGSSDSYDWDKCRFYIDDVLQFDYGAHSRWENFEYEVSAGTHTFKWIYKKDGSVNPTGDAFFIDDLCFDADMFLPITLLYFTVTTNPEGNLLEWTTATEEHNAGFNLQRSTDAIEWTDFAWIPTACGGNSIENTNYSFLDGNPPSDTTYYRFEQMESTSYSTTYYSDIVVAMRESVTNNITPSVYYDNGVCLVGGNKVCDAYIYYPDGRLRYVTRLNPYDAKRLNIYGFYIIEVLWVEEGDLQRKTFKVFSY